MDIIAKIINEAISEYRDAQDGTYLPSEGEFIMQKLAENNFLIEPCPLPGKIEQALCVTYNKTWAQISSKKRYHELVEPRQVGMLFNFIIKDMTRFTYSDISRKYGYCNHGGPFYAKRKVLELLQQPGEKLLREHVNKVSELTGIEYKHLL